MPDQAQMLTYRTSTFCAGASCVAMAVDTTQGHLVIKDTKDGGGELRFTPEEIRSFIAGLNANEFEDLIVAAESGGH